MQEIDTRLTEMRFETPIVHSAISAYEQADGKISEKDTLIQIIQCLAKSEKDKTDQLVKLHKESSLPQGIYGILSQTQMPDGSIDSIIRYKTTPEMIACSVNGGNPSLHSKTKIKME